MAGAAPDASTSATEVPLIDLHAKFVHNLDRGKGTFEHWTMQHLRVSGIYWAMGAMHVMDRLQGAHEDRG